MLEVQNAADVPTVWEHRVAVFDVDRTLLPGSSLVRLGRALMTEGLVSRAAVSRELAREVVFARRGSTDAGVTSLRSRLLSLAAGQDHAAIADIARRVGRDVATDVYGTARWIIDRHLEAGHFCVLLSASPQELVESLGLVLGVQRAVGTRVEIVDGRMTGRLAGTFCYGDGKLVRLREDVGDVDLARASAYSDSASDLPLLDACGRPVAVNPEGRLRRIARRRRWPVIRFA